MSIANERKRWLGRTSRIMISGLCLSAFVASAGAETPSEKQRREQIDAYEKAVRENPDMDILVGPDGKIRIVDPECYLKRIQERDAAAAENRPRKPIPGCVFN